MGMAISPASETQRCSATGKTTTAKRFAASTVALANDRERSAFAADIEAALALRPEPILVDEWQEVPASLGHIKTLVDTEPRPGRFLITGSVRGDVDAQTWPGTGRAIRLEIYGLTEREIEERAAEPIWLDGVLHGAVERPSSELRLVDYFERALRSGFPEPALVLNEMARTRWLTSHVDQLVTHDATSSTPGSSSGPSGSTATKFCPLGTYSDASSKPSSSHSYAPSSR